MYKKILIMALIMSQWSLVNSQTISRKSISSAGSTLTGGSYMITFNIGETVIPTLSAGGTIITQGFEQPGEQIKTGIISAAACVGTVVNVPFTAADLLATNTYTAQLSDATGSFASPTNIGTLAGNSRAATIAATIPVNTPGGNGYKIRVVGSVPLTIGTSSAAITLNPLPTVSIVGLNATYCKSGNPVVLTGSPAGGSFTIDGIAATVFNPSLLSVGNHTVVYTYSDGNGCSNTATAIVTLPPNIVFGIPSVTNVKCLGGNSGKVIVSASGGTGAFSYSISPNIGTQSPVGTFNGLTAQTYTFTATDANGCTKTTTATVGTNPNILPIVSLTAPANGAIFATSTTLTATASDPDGTISRVNFYWVVGTTKTGAPSRQLLGSDNTAPYSFNWINIPGNNYVLQAEAVDDCNASVFSNTVTVNVLETFTVLINSPVNGQNLVAGTSMTISASVTAYTSRTITKVEFFYNGTKLGEDLTAPYTYFWNAIPSGTFTLQAVATDNLGGLWYSPYTFLIGINTGASLSASSVSSIQPTALSLSPNPTSTQVNVRSTIAEEGYYGLNIIDALGRTVLSRQMTYQKGVYTETLDVSNFSKGLYFVRLANTNGKDVSIQKLIVN